jgi:hypothetical protein
MTPQIFRKILIRKDFDVIYSCDYLFFSGPTASLDRLDRHNFFIHLRISRNQAPMRKAAESAENRKK